MVKNNQSFNNIDEKILHKVEQLYCKEKYDKAAKLLSPLLLNYPVSLKAMQLHADILFKQEKNDQAIVVLKECLRGYPDVPDVWHTLGNIYRSSYKYDDALVCYDTAIAKSPSFFFAYYNKGILQELEQDDDAALKSFKLAIKANNKFTPACLSIIQIYKKRNKLFAAYKLCKRILKHDPENEKVIMLLSTLESEFGNIPASIKLMQVIKDSKKVGLPANATTIYNLHLLTETKQSQILQKTIEFNEKFLQPNYHKQCPHINSPITDRKIRIGFVSADFNLHPVARHLRPVIQNIDKNRFEIYAYNNRNVYDYVTTEFKEIFTFWRDIHGLSDSKAVEVIRLDTIDILFDLSGYTGSSRLVLFSYKPAPIQISWIGYFNTTGLTTMDYLIADEIMITTTEEDLFTENILRMPDIRFCYDPRLDLVPDVSKELPAEKNGYITFGAFTKVNKLNDEVIRSWCSIMRRLPGSRLILKWPAYKDTYLISLMKKRFLKLGVSGDRLEFRQESGYRELLQEYTNDIDIVLDTFPHSGGSTSCDALIMGVPVVTYSGSLPISRQTHGFLNVIGFVDKLVAFSVDEYINKAVELANNKVLLQQIRLQLRDDFLKSKLCDGLGFTKHFELAMTGLWEHWSQSKTIEHSLQYEKLNIDEVYNEGINLMEQGLFEFASYYFSKVIELSPKNYNALNNLGICLWELGEIDKAKAAFYRGYRVNKENSDILCNLSGLHFSKNSIKSLMFANKGLVLNDNNFDLHVNRLLALIDLARYSEALDAFDVLQRKFSSSAKLLAILGNCCGAMGRVVESYNYYSKSLKIDATNMDVHSNLLFVSNYIESINQNKILTLAKKWENNYAYPFKKNNVKLRVKNNKKLKVGFVSSDLHSHPVGKLVEAFFKYYDHSILEIYCYYNNNKYKEITNRIMNNVTKWHEVMFLSDDQLFDLIDVDQPDILIDLNGHTDGNRLKLFGMKPCAIQATWIGYFNTTGLSAIDYFISDEFTTPIWMQKYFTEKIVFLPHSRFCFLTPEYSPLVSLSPSEWRDSITFGAYNNIAKMSDAVLELWGEILKKVPKSRIILKWKSFRDQGVRETMYKRFEALGIKRYRILLRRDSRHGQMMADYSDVDIVLDTYPFNGGMTSLEALWMGVPIVTLSGKTPASRQTGSFLQLLGLDNLIAYKPHEYIDAAVTLATDKERLYDIRGTLRQRMSESALMDGKLFARNVEDLLFKMYNEQLEKQQSACECRVV